MCQTGENFVFDAEAALKAATQAVIGLASTWKLRLQESDRKELVAEAVAKAWDKRSSYDPGKASFGTWVGCITRNTLLDFLRKRRDGEDAGGRAAEVGTGKAPDTLMMEDEGLDALLRAVGALPEAVREVILLLSEGKRPRDIAGVLGCTPNAAAIRCCRARRALRKKLNGEA